MVGIVGSCPNAVFFVRWDQVEVLGKFDGIDTPYSPWGVAKGLLVVHQKEVFNQKPIKQKIVYNPYSPIGEAKGLLVVLQKEVFKQEKQKHKIVYNLMPQQRFGHSNVVQ